MTELLLERSYSRPPESEIYGRSLSSIRRLGAFMIDQSQAEVVSSPEADQARVEFYTSVEEGFGTDMELGGGLEVRDFDERPIINGRVMSKDLKTPVSVMTVAGLRCAEKTAEQDKRFLPQLTRSYWDHQNALHVDSMARGETDYNTTIVASPFVEEAAAESGNEYWRNIGYVPKQKRGFVQLYHFNGKSIISGSLSFDGSNKKRLREIFGQNGMTIPEGEITDNWLKYVITGKFSEATAKTLATAIADQAGDKKYKKTTNTVDVTREYGSIMDNAFNQSYIHVCESLARGYQTKEVRELIFQLANKAQHFNERYVKALYKMRSDEGRFTDDDSIVLHELLVYSTIEMMRALHLRKKALQHNYGPSNNRFNPAYLQSMDPSSFQNMLAGYGAEGARSRRTYSACGLAISPGNENSFGLGDSPQTAFGGVDNKETLADDKYGSRYFKCPKGHKNIRKEENKLVEKCQVCKCDVSCKKP